MTYKTIKDEFGNLEIYYEADCPENSDYLHKTLKGLFNSLKTLDDSEEEVKFKLNRETNKEKIKKLRLRLQKIKERKNVLMPDEEILRIGKKGNSIYELVTKFSLQKNKNKRLVTCATNIRRMSREMIKLSLISRATTNPQDIEALNNLIINLMTNISREMAQMTMLQIPVANI
jgi:hypothetical protein